MSRRIGAAAIAAVAVIAVLVTYRLAFIRWAQAEFGFRRGDGNSPHYLFWSGIGSDLAYLSIVGTALIYYRKENCKRSWCPFLGHYEFTNPETGITRKLCWIHHPDVHRKKLSADHIKDIQRKRHVYIGDRPGRG
jgi:hypothetical protein